MRRLLDGFAGCFTTPTFEVFQAMVIGLIALRLLVDRRDELGRTRTQTVNRLHRLLLELVPGGAKRFLTAAQAQPRCTIVRNINRPRGCGRIQSRPAIEIRPDPLPDSATVGVWPRLAQVRAIGGRMF